MSIEEIQKIDIVATKPGSNEVRLVITDHLPWEDLQAHAELLQEKINTYIAFVESGQLFEMDDQPIPENAEVTIVVAAQHEPPNAAQQFLGKVADFLSGVGLGFLFEVRQV